MAMCQLAACVIRLLCRPRMPPSENPTSGTPLWTVCAPTLLRQRSPFPTQILLCPQQVPSVDSERSAQPPAPQAMSPQRADAVQRQQRLEQPHQTATVAAPKVQSISLSVEV